MYTAKKLINGKGGVAEMPPRVAAMRNLCAELHQNLAIAASLPANSPKREQLVAAKRASLGRLQALAAGGPVAIR